RSSTSPILAKRRSPASDTPRIRGSFHTSSFVMTGEGASNGQEGGGASPSEVALQLPSDLRVIEAAVSHLVSRCRACSFEGPRLELNFRVGVTEALANAVLYGNQSDPRKTVRVELRVDAEQVVVCVADEGKGFDPSSVPDP